MEVIQIILALSFGFTMANAFIISITDLIDCHDLLRRNCLDHYLSRNNLPPNDYDVKYCKHDIDKLRTIYDTIEDILKDQHNENRNNN